MRKVISTAATMILLTGLISPITMNATEIDSMYSDHNNGDSDCDGLTNNE